MISGKEEQLLLDAHAISMAFCACVLISSGLMSDITYLLYTHTSVISVVVKHLCGVLDISPVIILKRSIALHLSQLEFA